MQKVITPSLVTTQVVPASQSGIRGVPAHCATQVPISVVGSTPQQ